MGKHGVRRRTARAKKPKTKLGLPDLDHSKAAVLDSLRSPESKRGYRHAIDEFIQWYCSEPRLSFNKVVVTRFRIALENRRLAAGTINGRLAAVRRLAYEAADAGLLSPELAAGIRRVKGVKKLGVRLENWLTAEEARQLWQAPDANTLKGKRDRAILAVLLGCGLRRRELTDLDFTHLQQREEHWAIVDLVGKGGHIRTVPVPSWVNDCRRLGRGRRTPNGQAIPLRLPGWQVLERGCDRTPGVACGKAIRWRARLQDRRAARPEALVCKAVPCCWWRTGADPVPAGPRLGANNRTLSRLQTADSRSSKRSDRH